MQPTTRLIWPTLLISVLCMILAGCSSSADSDPPTNPEPVTGMPPDIQLDGPALQLGPEIAVVHRPAGTDLVVAYSDEALPDDVSVDYVVGEWEKMKVCLGTTARAPYIVIVDGYLESVPSDDVLFNFEGRRLASATWSRDEINVIRVSHLDFDGSQGNAGFHLRSIIGRFLWTLNELPVRDYNTLCASAG